MYLQKARGFPLWQENQPQRVWYMTKVRGSLAYYHAARSSRDRIGKRISLMEVRIYNNEGYKFVEERV